MSSTEWKTVQLTPAHRISFSDPSVYELYYEKHRAEIESFQLGSPKESQKVGEDCE